MRSWIGTVLALSVVAAAPAVVRADDVARAKELFAQAEIHFRDASYREALALYEQAYRAKPLAGFHFNIGQCRRHLRQYAKAAEHFRRYLAESKNAKHADEARGLIAACEEELAKTRGTEATTPPASAPATSPVVVPTPPEPGSPRSGRRRLAPALFWSGVGVSAALLLTGAITGTMALSKSSRFNDPATSYSELQRLKDSGQTLKVASSVTVGVGLAASAATAVVFFFTDFRRGDRRIAAAPVPGGGLIAFTGGF